MVFQTGRGCYASFVEPLGLQVYGPDWKDDEHDKAESDYISANARLIAAAPDLLIACRAAATHLKSDRAQRCLEVVRAAIAKADGAETL